jgi:hypothetical protein
MAKNSRIVAVAEPTLYEKLDCRERWEQRLDEARLEFMHAQESVRMRNSDLISVKSAIAGYTNNGLLKEDEIDHSYRTPLKNAHKRAEEVRTALEEARKKSSALKDEIDGLEHDLAQSRDGITSSVEVTGFQDDVDASRAEVARIESLMAEQHRTRTDAQTRLQPDDRSAERADLAAKLALGEIDEQRLKEFDAESAKREQAMDGVAAEALPVAEAADSVIAGLERRLEAARRALSNLEAARPAVLAMYFHSLVKVEGARYVEIAHELRDSYLKLMGLNKLLGGNAIASDASQPLMVIPNFSLNADQPLGLHGEKWTLYRVAALTDFDKAREKLIEQLRALGIEI